jgi:hypothetical protein
MATIVRARNFFYIGVRALCKEDVLASPVREVTLRHLLIAST